MEADLVWRRSCAHRSMCSMSLRLSCVEYKACTAWLLQGIPLLAIVASFMQFAVAARWHTWRLQLSAAANAIVAAGSYLVCKCQGLHHKLVEWARRKNDVLLTLAGLLIPTGSIHIDETPRPTHSAATRH